MGNSTSTVDISGPSPPPKALHILRVSPGSPAAQTDIDPFFDFVVGIDNDELASVSLTTHGLLPGTPPETLRKTVDAATLSKLVEEHENKILPLVIWSAKYRNMRGMSQFHWFLCRFLTSNQSYLSFHQEIGHKTQAQPILKPIRHYLDSACDCVSQNWPWITFGTS